MSDERQLDLDALDFEKGNGMVTVVAQHATTGAVLMVAHADRGALERTIASGEMHYTSRTRGAWHKGATSGNVQKVVSLTADCDADAVLAVVHPAGPACHTGAATCFGTAGPAHDAIDALQRMLEDRMASLTTANAGGYTHRLLGDRNLRLKKLGEEAVELSVACADKDQHRIAEECADLIYHVLVAARAEGVTLAHIQRVLSGRAR